MYEPLNDAVETPFTVSHLRYLDLQALRLVQQVSMLRQQALDRADLLSNNSTN
jgi:hypothetical protein